MRFAAGILLLSVLALAGCAPADPPPTPTALCQAFGYTPGATDYERCVARREQDQAQRVRQNQVMQRLFSGSE